MSDKNVEAVREKLKQRAEAGLLKYGVTTERTDLTRKQWLIHAQEEALDFAVYLQRLIADEDNGKEETEAVKAFKKANPQYRTSRVEEISRADGGSVFVIYTEEVPPCVT